MPPLTTPPKEPFFSCGRCTSHPRCQIVMIHVDLDSFPHREEIEPIGAYTPSRTTVREPPNQLMADYRSTGSTNIIHILSFLVIAYLIYMSLTGVEHSEIQGTTYTMLTVLGIVVATKDRHLDR